MTREEEFLANLRVAIEANTAKRKKPARKKAAKKDYVKPESIIQLQEDYARWRMKQKEGCAQPVGSIFADNDANSITKAVVAHVYCNGGFAGRVNSTGTYKQAESRFIKSGSRNGMADVNACIKGRHVQIEVKYGSDKPRDAQLDVQREVEAAGGVYIFVKGFDDYLKKVSCLF